MIAKALRAAAKRLPEPSDQAAALVERFLQAMATDRGAVKDISESLSRGLEQVAAKVEERQAKDVFDRLWTAKDNQSGNQEVSKSILKGLTEREKQSSTGMQDGFAIPHSRMDEPIQATLVSLGVLARGLDFDAIDGQPTRTVVCLVTPRKQSREHLRVLAGIAQLFARPEFRAALLDAKSPAEVLAVIRAEEEQIPA